MVNVNMLRGKIAERGMTMKSVANAISVDPSTLYRKMQSGGATFTIREADCIVTALSLSLQDATAIFLAR